MSVYLFTVPLVAGKTDTWKKYLKEMTGPRNNDYVKSRKRLGVKIEQVFLQQTPQGDMVVVRWDTDNPQRVFEDMARSNDAFDEWFKDKVLTECHNMDLSGPIPKNEQILDYQATPSAAYAGTQKNR
jgi:hypothetical protein